MHVPIVFLTRLSDELSRLRGYRMGVDDFLPKDMATSEIVARLHGVVARRRQLPRLADAHALRGDLEHVRLGSLLAFLESERRSGALRLGRAADHAVLHLQQGALLRVENLGRYDHPHDRVFELLSWNYGQFEFLSLDDGDVSSQLPANDNQLTPLSYLLMEHARREDETRA
jgi:DNA-binding response OmpR family regulator